jgi:DNA-directed RNA polymerase subunit RPC12/RpoP
MSEPVDTSRVFKQPVLCVSCDEAFYFTLSSIAENQELVCPQCGKRINLRDETYLPLVSTIREVIGVIKAMKVDQHGAPLERPVD